MKPTVFKESHWQRLLDEIENGQIIPIIGPELLIVKIDGQEVQLYTWLASELAKRLDIDCNPENNNCISEIIYKYQDSSGVNYDPTEPYYQLFDILRNTTIGIPESFKILANIKNIRLFITTTFDELLEKALNEYRGKEELGVMSISFKETGTPDDIPSQYNSTVVYHMFGKINVVNDFVVTDEDLLKFSQKWHDPLRRPPHLSALLKDKEKYFMLLGCSFENWLTRFFLYGVKSETLFDPSSRRGLIADNKSQQNEELIGFLSRCQTNIYTGGNAIEFIRELGERWEKRMESRKIIPVENKTNNQIENEQFKKGSIFLSYASEDKIKARKIYDFLYSSGLDVWFDKIQLEGGDDYQRRIFRNIKDSSFFIPVISKNTITPERRFFRGEWNVAVSESIFRSPDIPFILPLVIDDTSAAAPHIPEEFKKVHWFMLENENNLSAFADLCIQKIRAIQKTNK